MASSRSQIEAVLCCPDGIVRDRLWMWGHPAGSHNTAKDKTQWPHTDYGIPNSSRMTPAEGALYMGIPNVVMVRYMGRPEPNSIAENAIPLSPFKRVVWSINLRVHRSRAPEFGWTPSDEAEHSVVRGLLKQYPNFTGIMLDDYFKSEGPMTRISKREDLIAFKAGFGHRDFWDGLYTSEIEQTNRDYLDLMDVVALWTRNDDDLPHLDQNLAKLESIHPRARTVLGCYMWDYLGDKKPLPVALMRHQCELGLKWLKNGRIEGLVFLSNNVCDMELETVEWARRWIQQVGDERI